MSKKQKAVLSNDFLEWIEHNFSAIVKGGKEADKSWEDIIGHIIISMDEALAQAEGIMKQAEAMITAETSDEENEGRPND